MRPAIACARGSTWSRCASATAARAPGWRSSIDEGTMSIAGDLKPEFEQEMASTRRLLERVPSDRATWKPHAKSFSLGHLAQLVSWMPGWIANALTSTSLDIGGAPGYSVETTETLLAGFDRNVSEARSALEK